MICFLRCSEICHAPYFVLRTDESSLEPDEKQACKTCSPLLALMMRLRARLCASSVRSKPTRVSHISPNIAHCVRCSWILDSEGRGARRKQKVDEARRCPKAVRWLECD
eukprot:scaffold109231_cov28-Tisochrysis_lutea.AAC.1